MTEGEDGARGGNEAASPSGGDGEAEGGAEAGADGAGGESEGGAEKGRKGGSGRGGGRGTGRCTNTIFINDYYTASRKIASPLDLFPRLRTFSTVTSHKTGSRFLER